MLTGGLREAQLWLIWNPQNRHEWATGIVEVYLRLVEVNDLNLDNKMMSSSRRDKV